jgi:phosphinothricin acetyltransferase
MEAGLMKNDIIIRTVSEFDARELLEIYRPYVENTAISFEYEVPSVKEFEKRIKDTLLKYPYIAAVHGNEIVGYAYAGVFKARKAYDWSVETSIYVKQGCTAMGYGKMLYNKLEKILKRQHILNLNACIAYADENDEYLTNTSMEFHKHMGYELVGKFNKCGYKFGRWYDMIWMEKIIGEHTAKPQDIIPFSKL